MSTTAIFATRLFGTVRKDLNRAITVRIRPLPNVAPRYTPTFSLKWSKYQKTGISLVFSVMVALLKEKKDLKWQVTCLWGMSFEGQSDLTQKVYQGCVPLG